MSLNTENILSAIEHCLSDDCANCDYEPSEAVAKVLLCPHALLADAGKVIRELREENTKMRADWAESQRRWEIAYDKLEGENKRLRRYSERTKPIEREGDYGDREVCCPSCGNSVVNYYAKKMNPPHCMMCGQALDWDT